jgi:hypothetical protein
MKKPTRRSSVLRLVLALWCAAFVVAPAGAGTTAVATTAPVPAAVRAQQAAERIDASLATLKTRSRPLQGLSAEGARVVAYALGADVRKIEVEALGERGKQLHDFYWVQGRLVAARTRRIDYAAPSGEPAQGRPATDTLVQDDQLWLANGRLVGLHQLGQPAATDTAAARELTTETTGLARSVKRLMQQRQPSDTCLWSCARTSGSECLRYQCD